LGAELAQQFKAEIDLVAGSGGVLDVVVDGTEIFSKRKAGHFPTIEELIPLITALRQPAEKN